MEEYLDALPPSERSRFLREAIANRLGMSDKMTYFNTTSPNVSQNPTMSATNTQGDYSVRPTNSHEYTEVKMIDRNGNQVFPTIDEPVDEPLFEAKEVDLEATLSNLFD
jgi:hypothetical protein